MGNRGTKRADCHDPIFCRIRQSRCSNHNSNYSYILIQGRLFFNSRFHDYCLQLTQFRRSSTVVLTTHSWAIVGCRQSLNSRFHGYWLQQTRFRRSSTVVLTTNTCSSSFLKFYLHRNNVFSCKEASHG